MFSVGLRRWKDAAPTEGAARGNEAGIGLIDVLSGLAVASILCGIAVSNLRTYDDSSDTVADGLVSIFRDARARALAATVAYTVDVSGTTVRTQYSPLCSTTTKTVDPTIQYRLPVGASLSNTAWSVCFDSRGFATNSMQASVTDSVGRTTTFEVVLGGATRKL